MNLLGDFRGDDVADDHVILTPQIARRHRRSRGRHRYAVALARLCVLAGTQPGDVVLDPFAGTGTTGAAALEAGRRFGGIDLVPRFIRMAHERLKLAAQSKP